MVVSEEVKRLGDFLEVVLTGFHDGLDVKTVGEMDVENDSKFSRSRAPQPEKIVEI